MHIYIRIYIHIYLHIYINMYIGVNFNNWKKTKNQIKNDKQNAVNRLEMDEGHDIYIYVYIYICMYLFL
jgi:hypothetical protein